MQAPLFTQRPLTFDATEKKKEGKKETRLFATMQCSFEQVRAAFKMRSSLGKTLLVKDSTPLDSLPEDCALTVYAAGGPSELKGAVSL